MSEHTHDHEHDHDDDCCCEHDHDHDDDCRCEHDHDHCCCDDDDDDCCCNHDHGEECDCCDYDHPHEEHQLAVAPTFTYHVLDVDCPHCALQCQNAVRLCKTVDDARLIYATATLEIVKDRAVSDDECLREVLACVRSCGQDLELTEEERIRLEAERSWWEENRERILMIISGITLGIGLILDHLAGFDAAAIPFYVIAAVAGLVFVAPMAIAALKRRTADMNVLMGIAVLGALIMGALGDSSVFGDAAIVIFLDQIGEWLEGWSMRRATGSIQGLMELAPDLTHVLGEDGNMEDVPTGEVEEGQLIRVLPGERVPLDGIIVSGASSFNEAAITGESVPADKTVGADVYAGSLNVQGVVDLEVTADDDCTTLARIVSMVQGAQAEKAPYESFIDRFAAVYTPLVVGAAIVVGLGVPLVLSIVTGFSGQLWHDWVYRALSLLVVACPCALVISTPVSFVSALSRAAHMGVLVKGGAFFDIASKVTAVTFDKTGTLTSGAPSVSEVVPLDATEDELIALAAALEMNSTHPLARAIVAYADERGVAAADAIDVEEIAANGMCATVAGECCRIGKLAFAEAELDVLPEAAREEALRVASTGATALVVTRGNAVAGVIGVADTIRPATRPAMEELLAVARVQRLEMLTGDHTHAAEAIAEQAGLTAVSAELLPEDKVARIQTLQSRGERVAMVGDGINDAPALAAANLGITMGAAASDTALEVADVALLSDDISQLPAFFALAVRTMHIVQENITFAIFVKALVFVLVIAGVAGMGAAVFADTGVALLVILNGLRLMLDSRLNW